MSSALAKEIILNEGSVFQTTLSSMVKNLLFANLHRAFAFSRKEGTVWDDFSIVVPKVSSKATSDEILEVVMESLQSIEQLIKNPDKVVHKETHRVGEVIWMNFFNEGSTKTTCARIVIDASGKNIRIDGSVILTPGAIHQLFGDVESVIS